METDAKALSAEDIYALERLHAEATEGEWRTEWHIDATYRLLCDESGGVFVGVVGDPVLPTRSASEAFKRAERDASAIAALHNAAPALLALARDGLAMRALREEAKPTLAEIERMQRMVRRGRDDDGNAVTNARALLDCIDAMDGQLGCIAARHLNPKGPAR